VVFDRSMHDRAMRRLVLENDLRHAIERGEMSVWYQPIVNLEDRGVGGLEALLRWRHPQHGMLAAADFIPLAEQTGLIVPIGEWVFEQVCRELAARPQLEYLSVNFSRRQLVDNNFIQPFEQILNRTGVDPARVVAEINESTLNLGDFFAAGSASTGFVRAGRHDSRDDPLLARWFQAWRLGDGGPGPPSGILGVAVRRIDALQRASAGLRSP